MTCRWSWSVAKPGFTKAPDNRIRHIYAKVGLESQATRELFLEQIRDNPDYDGWAAKLRSSSQLRLEVSLAAEADTGTRIQATGGFRIGGPRRGIGAIWKRYHGPHLPNDREEKLALLQREYRVGPLDIEDKINMMLGRDPNLHRPARLAWGNLIEAITETNIPNNRRGTDSSSVDRGAGQRR